jgi:cation transport ATPase
VVSLIVDKTGTGLRAGSRRSGHVADEVPHLAASLGSASEHQLRAAFVTAAGEKRLSLAGRSHAVVRSTRTPS